MTNRSRSAVAGSRHGGRLALVLFAVAFGTNVPTPLLVRYRELLDFDAVTYAAVFGCYALGLVPALLWAGPASDHHGRATLLRPFVALAVASSLVFLPAQALGTPLLYAGRFLQGVVAGVVFTVGSAWSQELAAAEPSGRGSARASLALSLGFGLGPLAAGFAGQYGPAPLVLPYLAHAAMAAGAALLVRTVPETVHDPGGRRRRFDIGVPSGAGKAVIAFLLPTAACVFTFPAVSVATFPTLIAQLNVGAQVATVGAVAGGVLGSGAIASRFAARLQPAVAATGAGLAGALGSLAALAASGTGDLALLALATLAFGLAYGGSITAGLVAIERLADPARRGGLVGLFYAVAYVGFFAPTGLALAAGPGSDLDAPLVGLAVFALAVAAVVATVGRAALREHTARPPPAPPTR